MKLRSRSVLNVQTLENRWVPAVNLVFSGGSLRLFGDDLDNVITLTSDAGNKITVDADGNNLGKYVVTGNIFVTAANGNDQVILDLDTNGDPIAGRFTVVAGNGDDVVLIDGAAIPGLTSVAGGAGADQLTVGGVGGTDFGDYLIYNGDSGANSLNIFDTSAVADGLIVSNVPLVTVDDTAKAGFVVLNNGAQTNGATVLFVATTQVAGNLTYVGGSQADGVTLEGAVNGDVVVAAGEGDNGLTLGAAAVVGGNLTFLAGGGADNSTFTAGAQVFGNATFNTGHGANVYTFSTAFTVSGDLTVNAGNGDDVITAFVATVNGRFTFNAGDGNNELELGSTAVIAGDVMYTGGSGTDDVTVLAALPGRLTAFLGAGADSFTWDLNATAGSAYLDFGVDLDTDVYDDSGLALPVSWDQTIVNLP